MEDYIDSIAFVRIPLEISFEESLKIIQKAIDENGQRLFAAGEIAELKNEVRDADLQSLMLAVISEDIKEEVDTKK